MSLFKDIIKAVQVKQLQKLRPAVDIPIFCYHQIGIEKTSVFPSLYVNKKTFESHIRCCLALGYHNISLTEAVDFIRKKMQFPKKAFVITFDDGYEGVYDHALPILRKYHCTATVFAIATKLISKNKITSYSFLNKAQLTDMTQEGISIGSHSLTHQDLTQIRPPEELWNEIFHSKKILEDILKVSVSHFAYPLGRFNQGVEDLIEKAGYLTGSSTRMGRLQYPEDIYRLRRISLNSDQTWQKFLYRLEFNSFLPSIDMGE